MARSGSTSAAAVSLRAETALALVLRKQHLAEPAAAPELSVIDDLVGLHATDPESPFLQLRARMAAFEPGRLEALLDHGRAAKVGCMRTTLFIEPASRVPLVLAATRALRLAGNHRFLSYYGLTRLGYERLAQRVEQALAGRALDAAELRDALGDVGTLTPVLVLMCDESRLVRWRGRGGWGRARPSYRLFREALPGVDLDRLDEVPAVAALVDWYLRRYGPVTEEDVAWWTGLPRGMVHEALRSNPDIVAARVEGWPAPHLLHQADLAALSKAQPVPPGAVSLLPVLDPYLQGYRHRERAVAPGHLPYVVDRGGNATSTILVAGRVAGVWDLVRRPVLELRIFLFGPLSAPARRRVATVAGGVAEYLAGRPVPVVEVAHMAALRDHHAGAFLSPLAPGRTR